MDKSITLLPKLSEKTYALAESKTYVVVVDKRLNRVSIARAVEAQFDVKVENVNTLNLKGKTKRVYNLSGKRARNAVGKRSDVKKAYVTLKEGFSLPFFEAVEEEEVKEQATQEKFDKAATKQAAKTEGKGFRRGILRGRKNSGARGGDK
jgi:large subunit ribosomal protein L23